MRRGSLFCGVMNLFYLISFLWCASSFQTSSRWISARPSRSTYAFRATAPSRSDDFANTYSDAMPKWLCDRCDKLGYKQPTEVQALALPHVFGGEDVILQAHTGSGKTLTYALPILSKVDPNRAAIQAVVVVPTRELGLQVAGVMRQLSSASPDKILIMSVMEGSNNRRQQLWAVAEPPHVVVGNPKSLQRLVDVGRLRLAAVSFVVLDEVDACLLNTDTRAELHALLSRHLSNSFQQAVDEDDQAGRNMEVNRVFVDRYKWPEPSSFRNHRQTILCSATIPQRQHFATQCFKNGWTETVPTVINPGQGSGLVPPQVVHEYVLCSVDQQVGMVTYLLEKERKRWLAKKEAHEAANGVGFQAICFTADGHVAERLHRRLSKLSRDKNRMGGSVLLDASAGLTARAKAVAAFRAGGVSRSGGSPGSPGSHNAQEPVEVLIASPDLAGRGLDVPGTCTAVLMDLPGDVSEYVHCAGRAGRLNREGRVITLLRAGQEFVLDRFSNELGVPIVRRDVKASRSTRRKEGI